MLVCPACGVERPGDERVCEACGMLLVPRDRQPVSERQARLRKIKPQLAEGRLVRVATARNQAEGEFIQGLLLEQGVPSLLKRSAGFDVPDFLAAGPRDVLVPEAGMDAARETLLQAEIIDPEHQAERGPAPLRLLAGLLGALLVGALIVVAIAALAH